MRRGRPRIYRRNVKCPDCGSNWCKKNGHQNNKQRYKCNECGRVFTPEALRKKRDLPEKLCNYSNTSSASNLTLIN